MKLSHLLAAAAAVTVVASLGIAKAGFQFTSPVAVVPSSGSAYGSMSDTRHDGTSSTYIACRAAVSVGPYPGSEVQCFASDAAGNYLSCYAYDADAAHLMAAVATITSGSYITFFADGAGKCTNIAVINGSHITPAY